MLKNSLDKNGNKLKGATVVTRFVKEQGGLESLVTNIYNKAYKKGVQVGANTAAAEAAAATANILGTLFTSQQSKRKIQ